MYKKCTSNVQAILKQCTKSVQAMYKNLTRKAQAMFKCTRDTELKPERKSGNIGLHLNYRTTELDTLCVRISRGETSTQQPYTKRANIPKPEKMCKLDL